MILSNGYNTLNFNQMISFEHVFDRLCFAKSSLDEIEKAK